MLPNDFNPQNEAFTPKGSKTEAFAVRYTEVYRQVLKALELDNLADLTAEQRQTVSHLCNIAASRQLHCICTAAPVN